MIIGFQLVAYLFVGGIAFLADIGFFVLFFELGVPVLVASAVSFTLATLVNYVLSYKFAFTRGRFRRGEEILRLFLVSLTGLVLNTLLVWLFVDFAELYPPYAKVAAVPFVFFWNYLDRRVLVFHPEVPVAGQAITATATRLRGRAGALRGRSE